MKKLLLITVFTSTALFANMATSVLKHEVKKELKHETKEKKKNVKYKDLDVNKKLKKEKRKIERKAIKVVL